MATLAELKQELSDLDDQIAAVRKTAKEYNIVGSHSVENFDLAELKKERAYLIKRIYRFQGYTGRTSPDFGD